MKAFFVLIIFSVTFAGISNAGKLDMQQEHTEKTARTVTLKTMHDHDCCHSDNDNQCDKHCLALSSCSGIISEFKIHLATKQQLFSLYLFSNHTPPHSRFLRPPIVS